MHHDVFGEIVYSRDEGWFGRCHLPAFAEYGRVANGMLPEPRADHLQGIFLLTIADYEGNGPSPGQINVFRHLIDNEREVCREVMSGLLDCYRYHHRSTWDWFRRHQGLIGRWLARRFSPPEYATAEDLKSYARCTGVEVGTESVGQFAWLGFDFHTAGNLEVEHGLSVIYHPEKGATWGTATAIHELT